MSLTTFFSLLKKIVLGCLFLGCAQVFAQKQIVPKGSLFIIGGGTRSPELIKQLVETANLGSKDYMVVLPMASAEPDTSFKYIRAQLKKAAKNTIVNFNFQAGKTNNKQWLDSLEKAKLIFITGGDQNRFMKTVLNTPIYTAIHQAYRKGATIAGTSAGAAIMSRYMITGEQLLGDTTYHDTFDKLWDKNIQFEEGLGLLDSVIIDQHFIKRSRYNRLISALVAFPKFECIGIDEGTAIIIHNKKALVAGDSQVVRFSEIKNPVVTRDSLIKLEDLHFSIFTSGDTFEIN